MAHDIPTPRFATDGDYEPDDNAIPPHTYRPSPTPDIRGDAYCHDCGRVAYGSSDHGFAFHWSCSACGDGIARWSTGPTWSVCDACKVASDAYDAAEGVDSGPWHDDSILSNVCHPGAAWSYVASVTGLSPDELRAASDAARQGARSDRLLRDGTDHRGRTYTEGN